MNFTIKITFLSLFFGFFFSSCETEISEGEPHTPIFSLKNVPKTNFRILGNRDTILMGKKGIKLHIPSDAFIDKDGIIYQDEVIIELIEIFSTKDIIMSDIITLSSDGQILESSGVFQIMINGTKGVASINPDIQIKVSIPEKGNGESNLFYGEIGKDAKLRWTESHLVEKDSSNYWLARGKKLLYNKCSPCHNVNLVSDLTGPALAWVSKRWNKMEDLISFTKNPTLLAEAGNLRAQYMLDWSDSEMINFDDLTNEEILSIYNYINEECSIRGIDSTIFGQTINKEVYTEHINRPDSIWGDGYKIMLITNTGFHATKGWYGLYDYPIVKDGEIIDFSVNLNNEKFLGKSRVKLIIPHRNIVLTAMYNETSKHYSFIRNTTKIRLKEGEKAFLLAVSKLESSPSAVLKEIEIGANEIESLILKKYTAQEIIKLIEKTF